MNSSSLDIHDLCFKKTCEIKKAVEDAADWTYAMRREMQEILPGLYLGPFYVATKSQVNRLIETGITHILCVRHELEAAVIHPHFPERFKYKVINLADSITSCIIPLLPQVKSFIDSSLKNGGKVLVHGNAGISRSASLVIAYIMETKVLPYVDAFSIVKNKRHCISPSDTFVQQLKEYEPIYKARRAYHMNGHTSKVTGLLKRCYDDMEELPTFSNNVMEVSEEASAF